MSRLYPPDLQPVDLCKNDLPPVCIKQEAASSDSSPSSSPAPKLPAARLLHAPLTRSTHPPPITQNRWANQFAHRPLTTIRSNSFDTADMTSAQVRLVLYLSPLHKRSQGQAMMQHQQQQMSMQQHA